MGRAAACYVERFSGESSPSAFSGCSHTYTSQGGTPVSAALERTVFVNASNTPTRSVWLKHGMQTKVGGLGVQPVVVDLKN